jgi:ribosomal protein S18 acetylase RimI-like enzyme
MISGYKNYQPKIMHNGVEIGEFRLNLHHDVKKGKICNKTEAFFCCFQIYEEYRRNHYATIFMKELINKVKNDGYSLLTLHCSDNNKIAKKLYISLGFKYDRKYSSNYSLKL